MSYCSVMVVPKSGPIRDGRDFSNAHRGAMMVWVALGQKYLGWDDSGMSVFMDSERLWDLVKDDRLEDCEVAVLACTFDTAMVRREHLAKLAGHLIAFLAFHKKCADSHLSAWAEYLLELDGDPPEDLAAVCWIQTSVVSDTWLIAPDEGEEESRWFDLSRDKGHFFIYEGQT